MKKLALLLTVIIMSVTTVNATEAISHPTDLPHDCRVKERLQREAAFEKRLGLTEEQKAKAKELRIKGHERIKPVMEEIRTKKHEAEVVKLSRISVEMQEEKLAKIDAELKVLEKKAHDIRQQNMKEFESILTKEQRKTLKQMKKEGRQRYQADHPCPRPMMLQMQK